MLPLLSTLSPNAAVLLLTAGLALIAVELNRPGSIVFGAFGLLLSLLAAGSLIRLHASPVSAIETAGSMTVLLLGSRRNMGWVVSACSTIVLILSITTLLPAIPGPRVSLWAAILCGLVLSTGTTVLTRIARRARQNKGLD